jgi:TM2 domain-containing membrane protein YozV
MSIAKKIVAGICGILLSGFGVHKFILGYSSEGALMLSLSLAGCGLTFLSCGLLFPLMLAITVMSVFGLVEGIIYLTMSDEQFASTYINNRKPWF